MEVESPVLAQLLWNRNIRTKEDIGAFLHPDWETGIHRPSDFLHMSAAVNRVFDALENKERITVHGDYDADGVTGSAVVIATIREIERLLARDTRYSILDTRIDFYIPHRDKEGYGLHRDTIPKLTERGTGLIITVDCGIACVDEIALAKQSGMDVIVIDHHQFGETLPDGHLIHPGLPEEIYPFKKLAAVGVAFKFACAFLDEARRRGYAVPEGWEKWLLDLVAIATVTDMVPLIGENRVLQTYGLRVLNKTRRIGLQALIRSADIKPGTLDATSVGFGLGPRLNAAGRMDHAEIALRLLLAATREEADALAADIERCNRERQEATRRMLDEAERKIDQAGSPDGKIFVFSDERWSPSLVGLVAGKFLERFGKPAIAIGRCENTWIGSGRSYDYYDITDAVRTVGDGLLARVGGHVQACGFTLLGSEHIPLLQERLFAHAQEHIRDEDLVPTIQIETEIPLDDADWPLATMLEKMEPFGQGNPRPIFISRRCPVLSSDAIGPTHNHMRLTLRKSNGNWIKAIGFKQGERAKEVVPGTMVDCVYTVTINEWNGKKNVECRIIDVRPTAD